MKNLLSWRLRLLFVLLLVAGKAGAQAPGWQMALAIGTPVGSSSNVRFTAVDASGNVYLAGSFSSTATFGTTTLTSAGSTDLFVAKWNPATGFVWVQQAGGTGGEGAQTLAVSGGSVYVTGYFSSPTLTLGATTLTYAGGNDEFIAKLIDGGSTSAWTWAQQVGGTGNDYIRALAASASNVYVAGHFDSPTLTFGATTLTTANGVAGFVAKLSDGGSTSTWTWAQQAQQAGGPATDVPTALTVSGGSVYVAGNFNSSTISFGATTLTNVGSYDGFVAKLTDGGSTSAWTWAQSAGGTGNDVPTALDVSGSIVYVAGNFQNPISFGVTTLTTAGGNDGFVAKLTDGGSSSAWTWAQQVGGTGNDGTYALSISGGSVYVAGSFNSSTISFGATTLTGTGNTHGFLAALTDPALATPANAPISVLILAPNPVHGATRLTGASSGAALTLLDALGRPVLTTTADAAGAATLDVRGLPAGLYVVRAGGAARRLVVE